MNNYILKYILFIIDSLNIISYCKFWVLIRMGTQKWTKYVIIFKYQLNYYHLNYYHLNNF